MLNISASTHHTRALARVFITWAWILLALPLYLGSTVAPVAPQLYSHCDTLAVPTAAQALLATPAQKFKAAEPVLDALPPVPQPGIALAVRSLALQPAACSDVPRLRSAVRQSPVLPRPPPRA